MYTVAMHYTNRTKYATFTTYWAAELRAHEWMCRNVHISSIEIFNSRGVLVERLRRK